MVTTYLIGRTRGEPKGISAELLRKVWGPEYVDDVDFLRIYIWRLRKKLEHDPEKPSRILTERGFGYRLVKPS